MMDKKVFFPLRIWLVFLASIGFLGACRHTRDSSTGCTSLCPRSRSLSPLRRSGSRSPRDGVVGSAPTQEGAGLMDRFLSSAAQPQGTPLLASRSVGSDDGGIRAGGDVRGGARGSSRTSFSSVSAGGDSSSDDMDMKVKVRGFEIALAEQAKASRRQERMLGAMFAMLSGRPAAFDFASVPTSSFADKYSGAGEALKASGSSHDSDGDSSGDCDWSGSDASDAVRAGRSTPRRRREVVAFPSTPGREKPANPGVFGLLFKDRIPAFHAYSDKTLFVFWGRDYDRASFEFMFVFAYSPKHEGVNCCESWDEMGSDVHARTYALAVCLQSLTEHLGLLTEPFDPLEGSSKASLQFKSNKGAPSATVDWPHQQILYKKRGIIAGRKLTEDEVKHLINSQLFMQLLNNLFTEYRIAYRSRHRRLTSQAGHKILCARRFFVDLIGVNTDFAADIESFRANLVTYLRSLESDDQNLDLLIELFPQRVKVDARGK